GVIALAFLIVLKITVVNDIPGNVRIASFILAPAVGRWVMVCAATMCPYARKGEGFGKAFVGNVKLKELLIASGILIVAGVGLLQVKFIVLMIPVLFFTFLSCFYVKRKINGVTGDVLGAMNELAEIVSLGTLLLLR
ncbi:MAG: adenosylcobinamide-GDP ribazoletransferase, partial [Candidatus Omnitrophota bacterium]|nr:adenosylcobinamide-GDP ribazoletransferase [Candidatus Omnitrophota bacterium]